MKEKKLWYVITCTHEHVQTNSKSSFLVRLVKDLDFAKKLMQSIYDDAEKGITGRHGITYSNPKWLDENHLKLQITSDININGWLHSTTTEIYQLSDDWDNNIFTDSPWILD